MKMIGYCLICFIILFVISTEASFVTISQLSYVQQYPKLGILLNHRSPLFLTNPNDVISFSLTVPNSINLGVFVVGLIPFVWATFEFWRRIAIGEPFGTGKDSVVIGEDMNPSSSRGRRTLGRGALITAYVLFALAAFFVIISVYSVLTTVDTASIME